VRCGRLIDGLSDEPHANAVLAIAGDRFEAVLSDAGPDAERRGEDWLDLSDYTVLPGLVDAHDHLGFDIGDIQAQAEGGVVRMALRAARNASIALRAGITTLRDLGEVGELGVVFRQAIEDGSIDGPRLIVAREWISRTGGHAWFAARQADGETDVRRAVREQARGGSDWAKIMVTGGILTPSSVPISRGFSDDEIEAAVSEAHVLGLPISAHAIGGDGLTACIQAGVDSVEHAYFATDGDLDMMAEGDIALVSTFGILDVGSTDERLKPPIRDKMKAAREACLSALSRARERGIRVGCGCDLNHASLTLELQGLVAAGFTPMEAIRAATRLNAEICRAAEVGRIEAGALADLVAVKGDPLEELGRLDDVMVVVKGGVLVVDERSGSASLRPRVTMAGVS
jgi:imidazolonepropionase-like amidohydrolase